MSPKALLIFVLLMHLTVHPLAHAFAASQVTSHGTAVSASNGVGEAGDECTLCRVASTLTVIVLLALLIAPRSSGRLSLTFAPVVLPAELLTQLPSRAPPLPA